MSGTEFPPQEDVQSGTPSTFSAVTAVLLLLAISAAAAAIIFFVWRMDQNAYTPDFPWLWRTGQHILETGSLPAGDIFSWPRAGEPWVLYQWLFEVLIALGERALGMPGLFALFTLLTIGTYLLAPLYGAVPRRVAPSFVLLPAALGLAVASVNLSLRPMIVTSAFLLLQYVLVQRLRRHDDRLRATALAILPLYLLWGNMHTGVTLGLASLVLFAAGDLAERRRVYLFAPGDPAIEGQPLPLQIYILLIASAFLASLVNPYGFGIYEYIAELSRQSYLNGLIAELQSPNFQSLRFRWFLLFMGALLFFLTRARRTVSAGDLLHLILFTTCTLHSARFIVWAVLFYVLILPRAIHHEWTTSREPDGPTGNPIPGLFSNWTRAGLLATTLTASIGFWFLLSDEPGGKLCKVVSPALAAYETAARPEDRLFNDPSIGSCLLARNPSQRVFIDTRFDFYGTDYVREAMETLQLMPGWRRTLDRREIDVAVIARAWPLAQALAADAAFVSVFEDENSVVVRRRSGPIPH